MADAFQLAFCMFVPEMSRIFTVQTATNFKWVGKSTVTYDKFTRLCRRCPKIWLWVQVSTPMGSIPLSPSSCNTPHPVSGEHWFMRPSISVGGLSVCYSFLIYVPGLVLIPPPQCVEDLQGRLLILKLRYLPEPLLARICKVPS